MKKQTATALSSLDWAISQSIGQPRQTDEFTSDEFFAAGGRATRSAAESRLKRMVQNGELLKRSLCISGANRSVYRRA